MKKVMGVFALMLIASSVMAGSISGLQHYDNWNPWIGSTDTINDGDVNVDADTLSGDSLTDIYLYVDVADAQVLDDANDYTDLLEDGLLDGTIVVAHSSYADNANHANYADVAGYAYRAGYAYNADRLDGWHGWQYRRYTRQWVMWEHDRAVARENQIEDDSLTRDGVLQDNIDAEEARAISEEQRIETESKDRDQVLQDNIDVVDDESKRRDRRLKRKINRVDDKHTDWNNAQDARITQNEADIDANKASIADNGRALNAIDKRVTKLEYQFEYIEGEVNIKTPAYQYADFSAKCGIKEAPRFIAEAGRESYDEAHTENRADYYLDAVLNAFMVGDGETGLTVEECVYVPYQYAGRDYNDDGGVSIDEGTTYCVYYPYALKEREMYPCELNREFVNYLFSNEKFVIHKGATGMPEFYVETTTEKIPIKTESSPSFDYNEFLCGMGINC